MDRDKAIRYLAIAWVVLAALSFVFGMGEFEVYVLTLLAAVIAVLWIGRPKRTTDRH